MKSEDNLSKDMGSMETSISDLQDELNVTHRPVRKHFKPGWLLIAVLVALVVGGSTFLITTRLTTIDFNTGTINKTCLIQNEQIELINEKFTQLVVLFDASLHNLPPGTPPPTEEILKLHAEFRKPIEPRVCR